MLEGGGVRSETSSNLLPNIAASTSEMRRLTDSSSTTGGVRSTRMRSDTVTIGRAILRDDLIISART
jgi:hypothetical protein